MMEERNETSIGYSSRVLSPTWTTNCGDELHSWQADHRLVLRMDERSLFFVDGFPTAPHGLSVRNTDALENVLRIYAKTNSPKV